MGQLNDLTQEAYDDGNLWHPNVEDNLLYYATALAGEVGEFCNAVKKIVRDGQTTERYEDAAKELTDSFVYLLATSKVLGMDLERWYVDVRERNEQRFGNGRSATTV